MRRSTLQALYNVSIEEVENFTKTYREMNLEEQTAVWAMLKEEVCSGEKERTATAMSYIMGILLPKICQIVHTSLPKRFGYNSSEEDFLQDIYIDILTNMERYQPYRDGHCVVGTVFFSARILGVVTSIIRKHQEAYEHETYGAATEDKEDYGSDVLDKLIALEIERKYGELQTLYRDSQYEEKYIKRALKKLLP